MIAATAPQRPQSGRNPTCGLCRSCKALIFKRYREVGAAKTAEAAEAAGPLTSAKFIGAAQ